ncbi:MAG TPA: response regulator [Terriglobales bacterium]|nr:response regulator [Terriglobales bacterium]
MTAQGKTILVAEDDAASRELLTEILRASGYRVVEAADGAAAVNELEQCRPDLVLVDIQMPKLSGYQVLSHLRTHSSHPATPVVAITAHAMRGDREQALEAGFDGYFAKPIEVAELRQRVAELLR